MNLEIKVVKEKGELLFQLAGCDVLFDVIFATWLTRGAVVIQRNNKKFDSGCIVNNSRDRNESYCFEGMNKIIGPDCFDYVLFSSMFAKGDTVEIKLEDDEYAKKFQFMLESLFRSRYEIRQLQKNHPKKSKCEIITLLVRKRKDKENISVTLPKRKVLRMGMETLNLQEKDLNILKRRLQDKK
jgi:hypothetical protein